MIDCADDLNVVTKPAWLLVADVDLDDRIGAARGAKLGRLVDADGADHVRPRALHELQIIGVIDDSVRVGVLEIDRQREAVLVANEAATVRRVEDSGSILTALASADFRSKPLDRLPIRLAQALGLSVDQLFWIER